MGGLGFLLSILVYLAIAYWVVRSIKARHFKWLALAFFVLLPTADAVVGRVYLKYLCAKEGGLKVYRVAEKVEGFMEEGATTDYWVKQYGYRFTEGIYPSRRIHRVSIRNGKVIWEENVTPQSQYRVRLVPFKVKGEVFGRSVWVVETVLGDEILATYTTIAFWGGWAERFLAGFSDGGISAVAICYYRDSNPRVEVVTNSLKR